MTATVTDLFCGAGGSSLGAEAAGMQLVMAANHWERALDALAFFQLNQTTTVSCDIENDQLRVWLDDGCLTWPFDAEDGADREVWWLPDGQAGAPLSANPDLNEEAAEALLNEITDAVATLAGYAYWEAREAVGRLRLVEPAPAVVVEWDTPTEGRLACPRCGESGGLLRMREELDDWRRVGPVERSEDGTLLVTIGDSDYGDGEEVGFHCLACGTPLADPADGYEAVYG